MPLVSIIIPCFNAEEYVAESIQSALDQTHPDCEVIVIDDGSTDRSLDVIQSFGDKIRWETGPNRGGCAARNRGIALASGEWIQFLDADDVLTPECVASKLGPAAGSTDYVCSQVGYLNLQQPEEASPIWHFPEYGTRELLFSGSPQTAAPLHRKSELLDIGGFTEGLTCCQELDLHLRMHARTGRKFIAIAPVGVRVRIRKDSLSRESGAPILTTWARIIERLADSISGSSRDSNIDPTILAQAMVRWAKCLCRNGEFAQADPLFQKAGKILPNRTLVRHAYPSPIVRQLVMIIGIVRFEKARKFLAAARRLAPAARP